MSIDLADYQTKAREAVKAFWGNREAARQKQIESGKADQGERAGVTAGKNMDGFLALIKDVIHHEALVPGGDEESGTYDGDLGTGVSGVWIYRRTRGEWGWFWQKNEPLDLIF
jgi:hypothetical protein